MSVSNTSDVPILAGGFISLQTIYQQTDIRLRRTKIICTIGPACWEVPQLETLIDAGMNVARLNFSHGDHVGHGKVLERIREAAKNKNRQIGILLDTKGPEIRSGFFADNAKSVELTKGETLILTTDYTFKGNARKLACSYKSLATTVQPGQSILVADGSLVLTVLTCHVDAGEVKCRIENNAKIGERKNMNLPGVVVDLPTFTEKDVDDIVNFGIKHGVDYIAASFVRKSSDVTNLRWLLAEHKGGQAIKIICKIENQEGLENYNEILQATDGIMVARGDLGMEIPPSKVFLAQKYMIRQANLAGKPVITATQMLESMINNPRPTRAECSDVANAVYDGTNSVMLSGETANGPYFEQACRVMAKTCVEAEASRNYNALFQSVRNSTLRALQKMSSTSAFPQLSSNESLASSAVKTSIDIRAKLIVVLSETGTTARYLSKFCPPCPVICLTPDPIVARQCSGTLSGVHAFIVDSLEDRDGLLRKTAYFAVQIKLAQPGELMVMICGNTYGHGRNDQLHVHVIQETTECAVVSSTNSDLPPGHLDNGISIPGLQ